MRRPPVNTNPLTCQRKRKFATRREAKDEVKRLRHKQDVWRVHAFYCLVCRCWHVGKRADTNRGGIVVHRKGGV